jgi:hypothetical protein
MQAIADRPKPPMNSGGLGFDKSQGNLPKNHRRLLGFFRVSVARIGVKIEEIPCSFPVYQGI